MDLTGGLTSLPVQTCASMVSVLRGRGGLPYLLMMFYVHGNFLRLIRDGGWEREWVPMSYRLHSETRQDQSNDKTLGWPL